MAVPKGAFRQAALVAVPLGLVALIFLTPAFVGRRSPQPTDIPFLLVEVTGQAWNGSVNESALLYVRSALGVPLYDYLAINVTGDANLTADCGGTLAGGGGNWSCGVRFVPSLWIKIPAADGLAVNVTAVAVREDTTFRYNATFAFTWGEAVWTLSVQPEDAAEPFDRLGIFSAPMRQEVPG